MKRLITNALILAPLAVLAQTEVPDTAQVLHEIVIEAPKVIRKADMDVYHPSASAVEYSKDGLQLLRNCMIPGLMVNDALGTITSGSSSVQVRINIHTDIHDFNKNLGLEANYIKNWEKSRFTTGGSFSLHRNRSTYRSLGDTVYHQS